MSIQGITNRYLSEMEAMVVADSAHTFERLVSAALRNVAVSVVADGYKALSVHQFEAPKELEVVLRSCKVEAFTEGSEASTMETPERFRFIREDSRHNRHEIERMVIW